MQTQLNDVSIIFDIGFAAIDGAYGWATQALALLLFVLVSTFFLKVLLVKLQKRLEKHNREWEASFVKALYRPFSCYIWLIAIIYACNIIAESIWQMHFINNAHTLITIGGILTGTWFLLRWNNNVIHFMTIKSKKRQIVMDQNKIDIIGKLITVFIVFMSILLLMEATDRSMQTIIAFGGIGGLALAFASQEVISNFFGGLMIYFTHPFVIGDWIKLPERDIEGHVEEIGWYMTLVRNFEKCPIYVPNSTFTKIIVVNPSRMTHRQIKEIFGIRYIDRPVLKNTIDDIRNMLHTHPDIDQQALIMVHFIDFGSSSLDIQFSAYTHKIGGESFANVKQDILLKIADIIAANGAEMACPTTFIEMPNGLTLN